MTKDNTTNTEPFNAAAYFDGLQPAHAQDKAQGDGLPDAVTAWLTAPRQEVPQEFLEAFDKWAEVHEVEQRIRARELLRPATHAEMDSQERAIAELVAERERLVALALGNEPPAPAPEQAPPATEPAPAPLPESAPFANPSQEPEPLTTGDIANVFDGLGGWNEQQWMKPLGDKPKWLRGSVAIPGKQGSHETRWNPVTLGAALIQQKGVAVKSVRARFQKRKQLMPWLDAWKTYEADYLDSDS